MPFSNSFWHSLGLCLWLLVDLGRCRRATYGAWRSSVARLLWEQEVPGSNPGAPIELTGTGGSDARYLCPLIGLRSAPSAGA